MSTTGTRTEGRASGPLRFFCSIWEERHRQPRLATKQHGPRYGGAPESVAHLVECRVERMAAATIERQRELERDVVVEVADRHADEREAATFDHGHRGSEQSLRSRKDRLGVGGRARQRV